MSGIGCWFDRCEVKTRRLKMENITIEKMILDAQEYLEYWDDERCQKWIDGGDE